ncbi:unnamed protein product [Nezara viridula]|uniref:SET domain-containing protein n=1 Tax=Nezara viridula TaxID=85310 RepID=A0A9P0EEE7_NEZVI|nr:unnamed protein product [Nezara viridula]
MKPGGGPPEAQTSLVVQLNPYGAAGGGGRGAIVPPRSQARHKLPMSPTGPRILPARNISALARPLPKLMSSPKKKTEEEEIEGIVERRPKYYKHLPLNYQYVLQDHNYCAPIPSPTSLISPKIAGPTHPNGISLPNGIRQPPLAPPTPIFRTGYTRGVTPEARNVSVKEEESDISSDGENATGNTEDGEETETAPEDEDSVTRCICEFQHDDGYMICCDKCLVWQHVDCMGIERGNIPEEYRCEECEPRKVDKARAIRLQLSKRSQFNDSSDSLESSSANTPPSKTGRNNSNNAGNTNARKNSTTTRTVARKRGERGTNSVGTASGSSASGTKSGRWRANAEAKRGKYTKPTAKLKPKKTLTKKREAPAEKKDVAATPVPELRSPSPGENIHQLRQWIDSYEEAVTNHYSQELRARISAIKVNGLHSELRLGGSVSATPKSKVSLLPSGLKILVTTAFIPSNQAIIEVRGKYMLAKATVTQGNGKQFIFHHRLNGPGSEVTEVQVDATTYGNDARFIRSSCSPNAEIRHCIEKGTLHLYIVSTVSIEAKTEITLPHRPGSTNCASGDKCSLSSQSMNDKRRRGRRRTLSESSTSTKSSSLSLNNNNNNNNNITKEPVGASKRPAPAPLSPEPTVIQPKASKTIVSAPSPPLTRESSNTKATRGQVSSRRATTPAAKSEERKRNPAISPPKKHDGKLTREERKMEAIMKAFERLEKDEQRKQLTSGTGSGRVRKSSSSLSPVREKHEKPQMRKKFRETRSSKTLRPRRNTVSKTHGSGSQPVRRTTRRRAQSEETDTDESESASVGGSAPSSPRTPPIPDNPVYEAATPIKDDNAVVHEPVNSSESESTPPPAVSNACLLVAAAVGPLAPGFKFPKTKKNLLNSWFGSNELNNEEVTQRPGLAPLLDCAKKRWLRQAISEDSDSPKHETGVSSPTDLAAPLKKRRFARESMSSEMSYTPPATPQAVDSQIQIYEYDDNSMEPHESSGGVTPQRDTLNDFEQQPLGGPKTPPSSISDTLPSPLQPPNKPPSPESSEDDKEKNSFKMKEEANRVKRKLSISEYRERVKSNPPAKSIIEVNQPSQETQSTIQITTSVEDIDADSEDFLTNSILFNVPAPPIDSTFKKGPIVGGAGFSAAPTLVEQQREALTERLRREFGLLISDDEEDKNKKGIPGAETIAMIPPPLVEVKKKRKLPPPPPPPPPLPPSGPLPPPPPPTNDFFYYQRPPPPSKLHWTTLN